jgi:hypothetical protein
VRKMIRGLPGLLLLVALMTLAAQAAAPPGPYFNGFEKNTDGWFDSTSGHYGNLTRQPSGYSNGGGYADGISSAAGQWHARLVGQPCFTTPNQDCAGPNTNWGGYSSTFPSGGYLTQVDIYLDVTWADGHRDYRFDWSSAINTNAPTTPPSFLRDFVFNAGTSLPLEPAGFWINSSTNAFRSGAFPENPCPNPPNPPPAMACRAPVFINTSGWYTFRHTFRDDAGSLAVDFDIFQQSSGTPVAHWTIHAGDSMSTVGGNRYGWFANEEIPDLAIDNSLRTGLCHSGHGDGEMDGKDSHRHHSHFNKNGCGDQNGEDDNVQDDDENSGSHFQSNSASTSTFSLDDNSQTITMVGTGVHDALPVGFTMIAVDNGSLAPGVFTLILTDGYVVTGSLPVGGLSIQ